MHLELKRSATKVLKIHASDLRLETTLKCGQSFRWVRIPNEDKSIVTFRCAFAHRVVTLTQNCVLAEISYSSTFPDGFKGPDDTLQVLRDYFNLNVDLQVLYQHWSSRDAHFHTISKAFLGLRMLRQDPLENLLCFICSSNNNIARITQMVHNLCKHYGKQVAVVDGLPYHEFPKVQDLLHNGLESELRALGFGYRAKFIAATAQQLSQRSPEFLFQLRSRTYEEAHAELMTFMGVGAKVADCVCLMSLDKHQAVPVDTHVLQIAQRDYKFRNKGSAMTKVLYEQIKQFFIDLWGPYAGWAHSVLFVADLKAFKLEGKQVVVKEEVTSIKVEDAIEDIISTVSPPLVLKSEDQASEDLAPVMPKTENDNSADLASIEMKSEEPATIAPSRVVDTLTSQTAEVKQELKRAPTNVSDARAIRRTKRKRAQND